MARKALHSRTFLLAALLFANFEGKTQQQPPPAKSAAKPIEVYNSQRPVINYSESRPAVSEDQMNPYNNTAPYNPYATPNTAPVYNPNAPYIPSQEVLQEEPKSLSRLSGGAGLSMTNVGVINSMFRQTNDKIYKKSNY